MPIRAKAPWAGLGVALAVLAGIVVLTVALFASVDLAYNDSGNSCRSLTDAAARDLADALYPAKIGLAVWVFATALAWGIPAGRASAEPWALMAGLLGILLAVAVPVFVGVDGLAFVLLVPLWGVAGLVAAWLARRVRQSWREPLATWLGLGLAWLLLSGGVLPVLLMSLTDNGEIRSC